MQKNSILMQYLPNNSWFLKIGLKALQKKLCLGPKEFSATLLMISEWIMATHFIHDFACVGAVRKMSGGIKVYSVKVSLFNISTSTAAGCQRIWLGIEIGFGQLNCLFLNLWMIALKKKFLKKTSRITKLPVHAFLFARISSEARHFLILGKLLSSNAHPRFNQ